MKITSARTTLVIGILVLFVSVSQFMQCTTDEKTREKQDESGSPDAWNSSINAMFRLYSQNPDGILIEPLKLVLMIFKRTEVPIHLMLHKG